MNCQELIAILAEYPRLAEVQVNGAGPLAAVESKTGTVILIGAIEIVSDSTAPLASKPAARKASQKRA